MTALEALSRAEEELNGISVPVPMLQGIGMPIRNALGMIRATIEWLEKVEQEQAENKDGKEAEDNAAN